MPHLYDLNPHLRPKKEPTVAKAPVKAKAEPPKKRGRPKGSKNKK